MMVCLMATKCKYKEKDRRLNEHFTNSINDPAMMAEITKELTAMKNMSKVTIKYALAWAKWIEAQRSQKAMLYSLTDNKEFDTVSRTKYRTEPDDYVERHMSTQQKENTQHCRYFEIIHQPVQCSAYGKTCSNCFKLNHYR